MSGPRPAWLRAALGPALPLYRALRRLPRRHWYGLPRPRWWPRGWAWAVGPSHQHDGRAVTLFAGGQPALFVPVTYGRYRGHMFAGHLRPTAGELRARLRALGLDPAKAELLAAVSSLEGGFDTLHTYGQARIAWGFIQFTGTGGLPALLARLKREAPQLFARYFQPAGLDVEPGRLVVKAGRRRLRGWRALNHLHGEPALWLPFVRAGQDPAVQDLQIRAAYEHYLLRAGALAVEAHGARHVLGELLAGQPDGEALLFDRAVSRGLAHTQRLFQRAVRQVDLGAPSAAADLLAASHRLDPGYQPRWAALQRALAGARDED